MFSVVTKPNDIIDTRLAFEFWPKDIEGLHDKKKTYDQRQYYLADTEAIVEPCCVIPDIGGPINRYFLVHSRTKWAASFTKWIEEPHALDHIDSGSDDDD